MINYEDHRLKLQSIIFAKGERKAQEQEAKVETPQCTHKRQRFTQTIRPDNPNFRGEAHFVVSACVPCKLKSYLELVVTP
ncbi:hypothetical protein GTC6_05347 [Gordonia terrae C-6]|uniref:Uncharacterized protein n=1 Tax=Gordonia terrae C-6 TaxID=1316928 RepID=R7YCN7_9ACTN|nr:hypothetical protein [Gordonia terrae]EON33766.1 hypothetical protein GTC6_05347 [Gordonia terrae C-6]